MAEASSLTLGFQFGGRRYEDAATGLAALAKQWDVSVSAMAPGVADELRTLMAGIVEALARRHGAPWPGGTSPAGVEPGTMSRRSAGIASGLTAVVEGERIEEMEGRILGDEVARAHEFGATIRPRRARYLTVPLPPALDGSGVPLRPRARDWPNTFVRRSRAGNLLIFQKRGREIVPLYLLVGPGERRSEVVIPPRLGVGLTFTAVRQAFADRLVARAVRELRQAGQVGVP